MPAVSELRRVLQKLEEIDAKLDRLLVDADPMIPVEAAMKITGLSRHAIYAGTSSENGMAPRIPHYRAGKRLYFRVSELHDYMAGYKIHSRDELARLK